MPDFCPECGAYWECECRESGPEWIIIQEATNIDEAVWEKLRTRIKGHLIHTGSLLGDPDAPSSQT